MKIAFMCKKYLGVIIFKIGSKNLARHLCSISTRYNILCYRVSVCFLCMTEILCQSDGLDFIDDSINYSDGKDSRVES